MSQTRTTIKALNTLRHRGAIRGEWKHKRDTGGLKLDDESQVKES